MIPTIEVTTQSIKGKYNVSEKMAHQIIRLILDEEDKIQSKGALPTEEEYEKQ